MDLKEKLISIKPRERSGSKSSNRFDYQKDWAICKIIELHNRGTDYLIAFEYHEDIIILNSSTTPDRISFYQVKTKERGNWTLNALLKRESLYLDAGHSYLGKLYSNKINFHTETESLNFVSNARFKFEMKEINGKSIHMNRICCSELSEESLRRIQYAIIEEYELSKELDFEEISFFEVTDLSIENHTEITRSRLAEFIEKIFPDTRYQITPIYQSIFDEVRRKSNQERALDSFHDLVNKRAIRREDFNKILATINSGESFKELGGKIEQMLINENLGYGFIKKFRNSWRELEVYNMNQADELLEGIHKKIYKLIEDLPKEVSETTLFECMNYVYKLYIDSQIDQNVYDEAFVKAIILKGMFVHE